MTYPCADLLAQQGVGLVDTYIDFIGTHEADNRRALERTAPTNPMHASLSIGYACMELTYGCDQSAQTTLRAAHNNLGTFLGKPNTPQHIRLNAIHLRNTVKLLLAHDSSEAVVQHQQATYRAAMTGMRRDSQALSERPVVNAKENKDRLIGELTGSVTQDRFLALLTRSEGPPVLATAALLHHDKGPVQQANFDLMLVEQGWDRKQSPEVHRLQTKHCCLGFCGDEIGQRAGKRLLAQYGEDILLVSDHCDSGMSPYAHGSNPLNRMLHNEKDRRAGNGRDTRKLNAIVTNFLADVTYWNDNRRGLRPPEGFPTFDFSQERRLARQHVGAVAVAA
ncbi:MAG TPA: hypothetical protein VLI54_05330 [Bacillota bacterium]|nr:hypothetical protein [Bacillota bacterium]